MRRLFSVFAVMLITVSVISSCAKATKDDIDAQRKLSFEAWMELYGDGAEKQPSGIYIKKIKSSNLDGARRPKDGNWVMVNYTARKMVAQDIFVTRDSLVAKQLGVFYPYTQYVPNVQKMASDNTTGMILGNYYALKGMLEGDVCRVYIPPHLAYGSNGSGFEPSLGYATQIQAGPNTAIIMDLELVKVMPDIEEYEADQVRRYAANKMGLSLLDTIKNNVYMKHISYGIDTAHVVKDSTIKYVYVGTFLDDFMFDTNIADTARRRGRFSSVKKYVPSEAIVGSEGGSSADNSSSSSSSETGGVISGVDAAFMKMRYGETVEVIMTSENGYGAEGSTPLYQNPGTVIQPYSPLRFYITVAPKYGDGTYTFPYTPYGAQRDMGNKKGVWIEGYIVGAALGPTLNGAQMSSTVTVDDNVLLSVRTKETDPLRCVGVNLPMGEIRDALNLKASNKRYNLKVMVYGDVETYFGYPGVVNVTKYVILN